MMVKPIRENTVEQELVRRVRNRGGRIDKLRFIGTRGAFDRIVILPARGRWGRPRIIFVECKKPKGGVISAQQILVHDAYRRLGCEVAIVKNSADIDRLIGSTPK